MTSAETVLKEIVTRKAYEPMSREDAQGLANVWYGMGVDNGVTSDELEAAAGMPLVDYVLRTFGENGQQLEI